MFPFRQSFSRHSRSIDPTTHGCPCGSKLVEIDSDGNPKQPRLKVLTDANGNIASTPTKKKSDWQDFLAKEGPVVRREMPGVKSEDVFRIVAERWKVVKGGKAKQQEAQG